MRRFLLIAILSTAALLPGCAKRSSGDDKGTEVADATSPASRSSSSNKDEFKLVYPETRKSDQVDTYHGTEVADPYRWLEDPNSEESRKWIEAQNKLTASYLEQVPERAWIKQRLTKLWDYEKFGVPTQRGGKYLYSRNDGLQNQSVLYVADGLDAEPRELLDPNKLSEDGTVALTGYESSDDGRLLAYGLATAGSDWQEWRVRDVETGKDLEDHLQWVKFSGVSWTPDGKGFYYSRYDEPSAETKLTGTNYYQKLFYHKIGTPQSEDRLIYKRDDEKEWGFSGHVTDDGRYLIISVWRGTEQKNQVFYKDLAKPESEVVELISKFEAEYSFVGNDGPLFYFRTDLDAPRYRLIAVNSEQPARDQWRELVPTAEDVLEDVRLIGGRFLASYLKDARSHVQVFDKAGKSMGELELPGIGTVSGFTGRQDDTETFYAYTSFTTPTTIYRYDVPTEKSTVFREPDVDFDSEAYETKQVFYKSADGTRVPMFIMHRKGIKLDGKNPTMLYGYGGFNISLSPSFSIGRLVWLDMGGVYAVPNLRGGGEYGRSWHEAGMHKNKQNVFDDFIAAAEWLIAEKYTSPEKLAISGGSNGGLLVGACITQRPELFGAAVPAVGVMDMLRYQKFTIGWAWMSEYGSSDDPEQFKTLLAYSPLHNIEPGKSYPATLVTTSDHDDRVVPAHSFKFTAALQAAQAGPEPILARIETRAGHGAGTPTSKQIETLADSYAFLVRALDVEVPDQKSE